MLKIVENIMATSSSDIVKLVKDELLPVYLKYHREHTLETPRRVLDFITETGILREPQIPVLFKPPKK